MVEDSLLKAIRTEPERFLSYVQFRNIRNPEDLIKAIKRAFDTNLGRNMLNFMEKTHWEALLGSNKAQQHFKRIKQLTNLHSFMKEQLMARVKSVIREDDPDAIKWVEVKTKSGQHYHKGYKKWNEQQEGFIIRNIKLTAEKLWDLYNKTFKSARTRGSIKYKKQKLGQV